MTFKDLKSKFGYSQSQTLLIVGVMFLVLLGLLGPIVYDTYYKNKVVSQLKIIYAKLVQADRIYAVRSYADSGIYDVSLPVDKFAEQYFVPYLPVDKYCKTSQSECWKTPKFRDMSGKPVKDSITYSIELANKAVIGFSKNQNNQIVLIVDIDGKIGANKLGKDVFVFYVYNDELIKKNCSPEEYSSVFIKNGIHKGGYDKCGIPHDVLGFSELTDANVSDSCNKDASSSLYGIGTGAGCLALIYSSSWVIDDFYPL